MKEKMGNFGAVFNAVEHTGIALLMAALTAIAGFGILVLSLIPSEQQFGIVTAITILHL